jgi:putative metalloprotease
MEQHIIAARCLALTVGMIIQASGDAVRAAALSDEDVRRLAYEVAKQSDRKHAVAPAGNPYSQRMQRLVDDNDEAANGSIFKFDKHRHSIDPWNWNDTCPLDFGRE